MTEPEPITERQLNRATLERQFLLRKESLPPEEAIRHLVGLQAQNPLDPYLALWSRLEGFDPEVMARLVEDRSLARIAVMRGTIHLLTADDALYLRPLVQPVLSAELSRHREYAPLLAGVDLGPVLDFGTTLLGERPLSGTELRSALQARFPDIDPAALAYACRCHLPLIQAPPRGVWGKTRQPMMATLDSWVGRALEEAPSLATMVLRYLAAFGPASVADVSTWSRLTGLRAVVEGLRPDLLVFRNEKGTELFDLPEAPRTDPAVPAPVRLLPEYDNLLLSHADRSRFGVRRLGDIRGPIKGTVLVDGTVQATWRFEKGPEISLVVEHQIQNKADRARVEEEANGLARFWHPEADVAIRMLAID